MSRHNPYHQNAPATLDAARRWRDRSLLSDISVLAERRLWTHELLVEVDAHFNERPDATKDRFQTKLQRQFADASPDACQLVAEMLWVMNLFPSNIGPESKRAAIMDAWGWSGETLADDHPMLDRSLLKGIGSAGPGFLAHRPRELRFFINAMLAFKALSETDQRELLADAWRLAEWLDGVPDEGYRQLKHILPFLLFPDEFERIASPGDIRRILTGLGGHDRRALKQLSKVELDRAMLELRQKLETTAGTPIDFYEEVYRQVWSPAEALPELKAESRKVEWAAPDTVSDHRTPLNQILYGPPGTGKTYQTIDHALQILDPAFASANESDREALKARFDDLTSAGRIRFVTFHQSFSYEDFVEGLRAEVRADGSINYVVADGVLKSFCRALEDGPKIETGTKFASGDVTP